MNINGMVNKNGQPAVGSKFSSSVLSEDPFTVAVTFHKAYDTNRQPVGVATIAGNDAGQACSINVSNTSLTFKTDGPAVPFFFMTTDEGLGYGSDK